MGSFTFRPLTWAALFFWFLTSILLIAATGDPQFVTGGIGAFQACPSGQSCRSIDSSCSAFGFTLQDCSKFQAFRAFLIIGLLLCLFVTIFAFVLFFLHKADQSFLVIFCILAFAEWLSILISFSVFAAWANNLGASKGDSFGLLVSGWVFGMLAWGLWVAGCVVEGEGVTSPWTAGKMSAAPTTTATLNRADPASVTNMSTASTNVPPPAYTTPAPQYGGTPV